MNNSEILIYQAADGKIKIDVRLEDETVWLTQNHMAGLFGKSKKTISEHIRNIFSEGELDSRVVVRNFRTTTRHGAIPYKTQSRDVQFYNLDVIISIGYRVKSHQGTQFRIWATQRLKEYIVKGFALNDERFKTGNSMVYFMELKNVSKDIRVLPVAGRGVNKEGRYSRTKRTLSRWRTFCSAAGGTFPFMEAFLASQSTVLPVILRNEMTKNLGQEQLRDQILHCAQDDTVPE